MGKEIEKRGRMQLERRRLMQARILEFMLQSGKLDYREAAKVLSKGDNKKARLWMKRWRRWMRTDAQFQTMVAEMCMGELRSALPQATAALERRAAKGNVPAIKLQMEASGFYSPRSTVDHTGEIAVVLKGGVRPPAVIDEPVEATVVED